MKTKVAVGILAVMGAVVFFHDSKPSKDELVQKSFDYAYDALESNLKDPGSLRTKDSTFHYHTTKEGDLAGAVCGMYNAKNSMGGYTGFNYYIVQVKVNNDGKSGITGELMAEGIDEYMFDASCKLFTKEYYPTKK